MVGRRRLIALLRSGVIARCLASEVGGDVIFHMHCGEDRVIGIH